MARILILRELPEGFRPLWNALHAYHELHYVENIPEAMKALHENTLDLIIGSAHLDNASVFEFITAVKGDAELRSIPFLCFSRERSKMANHLNKNTADTALFLGADKYLSIDSFCSAPEQCHACKDCPFLDPPCDFEGLRHAIEGLIAGGALKSKRYCGTEASPAPPLTTQLAWAPMGFSRFAKILRSPFRSIVAIT